MLAAANCNQKQISECPVVLFSLEWIIFASLFMFYSCSGNWIISVSRCHHWHLSHRSQDQDQVECDWQFMVKISTSDPVDMSRLHLVLVTLSGNANWTCVSVMGEQFVNSWFRQSVCLSGSCIVQNGWTDSGAVWGGDSWWPSAHSIRSRSQSLCGEGAHYGLSQITLVSCLISVCLLLCVCVLDYWWYVGRDFWQLVIDNIGMWH